MYFLVLNNTHRIKLYKMSEYQLPLNTMLMFIFILVNKVSTQEILSLMYLSITWLLLTLQLEYFLRMERLAVMVFLRKTKLCICNCMSKEAFESAGAALIKTKMQHFIC